MDKPLKFLAKTLTRAGDRYVGEYMDDPFHGQGTYTFARWNLNEGIFEIMVSSCVQIIIQTTKKHCLTVQVMCKCILA